jgi:hypothetical protein
MTNDSMTVVSTQRRFSIYTRKRCQRLAQRFQGTLYFPHFQCSNRSVGNSATVMTPMS